MKGLFSEISPNQNCMLDARFDEGFKMMQPLTFNVNYFENGEEEELKTNYDDDLRDMDRED